MTEQTTPTLNPTRVSAVIECFQNQLANAHNELAELSGNMALLKETYLNSLKLIEGLKATISDLNTQLNDHKQQAQVLQAQLDEGNNAKQQGSEEVDQLRLSNQALMDSNQSLRGEISSLTAQKEHVERNVVKLKEQIKTLESIKQEKRKTN